ncbi:hypothetical protein [Parapedobacter sp. DT-150]|uniref:hypothetical protein n=1 Tax=Parapedobacter sp. DT-150 TaxID=3396162 RepID=UPI003F1B3AD5
MGTAILVDELYDAGRKLITALDKKGIRIPTAFLAKLSDDDYAWSLLVAMDGVKANGSRPYYKRIQETILENNIPISLADIRVIDVRDNLAQSLQKMLHTGDEIGRINFFGHYINGQRFPDAVIYRAS